MKKILVIFGLLLVLALSVQAIEAPAISISLMNQDPDPVDPGEYVELRFKIINTQPGTVAENFEVRLDAVYPFFLDPSEEALRSIGNLPALGDAANAIVVKFKVRVDEKAVEGPNPIKVKYKHNTLEWINQEFDINIRTLDANLAITSVETTPDKIKPGDKALLKIKVKNMADSTLRDVTLKLDLTYSNLLDQATTTTDLVSMFNALPFAPIGSATEQKIFSLSPGEENVFTYNLIAFSEAESGIYKVPIEITYYDELTTQYTKNDIIGLIVGTKPDMSVILDESDIYVGKQKGTVTVRFINKGFSDVKFLDIKLDGTDEFEVISAKEVYVGNVDSDDYETAEFDLYLLNGALKEEKTIILPAHIEYRDANNNLYEENMDLELRVLKGEKLGMQQQSSAIYLVLLVFLVVVVIFFIRRRKKNR